MKVSVTFTEDEMWRIRNLAARRSTESRAAGIRTQKKSLDSDTEIDIQGMMGEMAVAKFFGEEPCVIPGPDEGFDLYVWSYKAQIKTTKHANGRLLMETKEEFVSDLAILCIIESENTVRLAGWVWKDVFLQQASEFKVRGQSGWALDQARLRPISDLLTGIAMKKMESVA